MAAALAEGDGTRERSVGCERRVSLCPAGRPRRIGWLLAALLTFAVPAAAQPLQLTPDQMYEGEQTVAFKIRNWDAGRNVNAPIVVAPTGCVSLSATVFELNHTGSEDQDVTATAGAISSETTCTIGITAGLHKRTRSFTLRPPKSFSFSPAVVDEGSTATVVMTVANLARRNTGAAYPVASPGCPALTPTPSTLEVPIADLDTSGSGSTSVSFTAGLVANDTTCTYTLTDSTVGANPTATLTVRNSETKNNPPPAIASATVNHTTLAIVFNEALDTTAGGTPAASAFTVTAGSGAGANPSSVSVSGSTVTLTLATAVTQGQTVSVSYAAPATGGRLRSADGDRAVGNFVGQSVTNNTRQPTVASAVVDGTALTIVFDEALDTAAGGTPAASAFTVTAGSGAGANPSSVSVSGRTVTLTLATTVTKGQAVSVSYTAPATGGRLRSVNGRAVKDFSGLSARNDTGLPPALSHVTAYPGYYTELKIVYDEALDTSEAGVPDVSDFTVIHGRYGGGERWVPSSVSVSGKVVTLRDRDGLASPVLVSYTARSSGGRLRSADGTRNAANFSRVKAFMGDPPGVASAIFNGRALTLNYNKRLDVSSVPAPGQFSVSVNGVAQTPTHVTLWRSHGPEAVTLTLGTPPASTDTVTVSYTVPESNPIKDTFGDLAFALTDREVSYFVTRAPDKPEVTAKAGDGSIEVSARFFDGGSFILVEQWQVQKTNSFPTFSDGWSHDGLRALRIGGFHRTYSNTFDRLTKGTTYYARVAAANDYNWDGALDYAYSQVVSVTPTVQVMQMGVGGSSQRSLSLRLNRELVADSLPSGSAFDVTATCSGGARNTAGTGTAAIDGDTIRVALAEAVADCERVAVRYERPETGPVLRDADGGLETPEFSAEDEVRTDGPEVAIVSDPGPDATYGQGDRIRVRLRYAEAVDVDTAGGTPRLKIKMDPEYGEKWADYESGAGTAALVFAYGPVVEPNLSPRGIAVLADTLELNGGSIVSAATGQAMSLDHAGLGHDPAHKVDHAAVPDAGPAAVTGVAITSTPRIDSDGDGEADTYGVGEFIEATVTWDRDVAWDVSAAGAGMRVRLDVGGAMKGADLVTDGAQSSTARSLAFRYEVVRSDRDADGVHPTPAADGSMVVLRAGATLKNAAGRDAQRAHAALAADPNHRVDGGRDADAETAAVLTASFEGVPATHDGSRLFGFEIVFSEEFSGLKLTAFEAWALEVAGGRLVETKRVTRDENRRVAVRVRPSSNADMTLTLAATTDCAAASAICAADGRKLSSSVSATVSGPGNAAATGAPAISGTARVGETLTASTDGISDADGLSGATFAFQWVRNADGSDTDIAGATDSSYTLGDSDVSAAIKVRVSFTDDAGNSEELTTGATAPVAARANAAATGAPAISGTARAGETLTASADGISDADGLSGAAFAFQWVRNADGSDTDISGAAGSSYTLADADVGAAIKVRASFTDDAGNGEELTSAATAAVEPRPLTAEFEGMPAEHDGAHLFSFELVFSENFPGRFPYTTLRDSAFTVTNGRVRGAERVVKGENRRWKITVRPSSNDDVSITLAAGAVSTESGRPLSNTVSATVTGPVGISVADARVEEGAGAVLAFAVTLSRAATSAFRVDYATSDGSAQAGADYTAANGTLSFQAGDSSGTIEVAVLDDAHDEGEETLTLTLSNASGAWLADGEATGTIENADLMPAALLARFGRATAEQVVEHIEERMAAPRRRGFRARFAGRELQSGQEGDFALGLLSQFAQPMGMGPAGAAPMAMGSHSADAGGFGAGTAGMGCATGAAGHGGCDGRRGPDGDGSPRCRLLRRGLRDGRGRHGRHGRRDEHERHGHVGPAGADGRLRAGGRRARRRPVGLDGDGRRSVLQLRVRAEPREPRRCAVGVEQQLAVALHRHGGCAVAQRRRADHDARGRLLARPADARPVGGPHPRDGRLQRPERRADDYVHDGVLPVGGLPAQRPGGGVGNDRIRDGLAEPDAGRPVGARDGRVDDDVGGGNAWRAGRLAGHRRVRAGVQGRRAVGRRGQRSPRRPDRPAQRVRGGGDAGAHRAGGIEGFHAGRRPAVANAERRGGSAPRRRRRRDGRGHGRRRRPRLHRCGHRAVAGRAGADAAGAPGRGIHRPRDVAVAGVGPDAVEPAGADRKGGPVVGRVGAGRSRRAVGQPDGLRHGLAPDVRGGRAAQRGGRLRAAGGRPLRGDAACRAEDIAVRPGLPIRLRPRGARPGEGELRAGGRRAAAGESGARRGQQRVHGPGDARVVGTWRQTDPVVLCVSLPGAFGKWRSGPTSRRRKRGRTGNAGARV